MENKTGKYFKYAIGEIVLVVIGILIALQVSNWNENRNTKQSSKLYLQSIVEELDSNTQLFRASLEITQNDLKASNYYLALFNEEDINKIKDSSITNMIDKLGNIIAYTPTQSAIDDFINSGELKVIKDNSLKKKILQIKFVYKAYNQIVITSKENSNRYLVPYLIKHANISKVTDSLNSLKIPDIKKNATKEAFVNNREFSNILFTLEVVNSRNENQIKSWINYLDKLARSIEKYLKEV